MTELSCFKAYDIRGKLGTELNENIAYRIGRAMATHFTPGRIVVGGDIRPTSEGLKRALAKGLMDSGVDVLDLGVSGTEEIYFAAFHLDVDGGIEVTASHNPLDYNGMKLVKRGAQPISGDSELRIIQELVQENAFAPLSSTPGSLTRYDIVPQYVDHLLGYIDLEVMKPLCIVADSGNGVAGHVIDALDERFEAAKVPVTFIKHNHEPDGSFPKGVPNPLLPEKRQETAKAVLDHGADMGLAWDGDFDRCFFYDAAGDFIEGYYIVGLLADAFLHKHPGEKILHDPRLVWNTTDIVTNHGGIPIQSKTGHAFIKERMRKENAVYGGEMSSHHYFREFGYCDSGMIPWLLLAELMSRTGQPLAQCVEERLKLYPCSGEVNFRVRDVASVIATIREAYLPQEPREDHTDGLSLEFGTWRFNLRGSNTEPLLRLNIESRGSVPLVQEKLRELSDMITSASA